MSSEKESIKLLTHENLQSIKNKDITVLDRIRNNNTDHVNERLFLSLIFALNEKNFKFAEEIKKRCSFTKVDNDLLLADRSEEGSVYDVYAYSNSTYRDSGYRQHPLTMKVFEVGECSCSATDTNEPVYSYYGSSAELPEYSFPNDLQPAMYNFNDLFSCNEKNKKIFQTWIETFDKDAPVRQLGEYYLDDGYNDDWWTSTPLGKDLSGDCECEEEEGHMVSDSYFGYACHPNNAAYIQELEEIIQHFEEFRFYERATGDL